MVYLKGIFRRPYDLCYRKEVQVGRSPKFQLRFCFHKHFFIHYTPVHLCRLLINLLPHILSYLSPIIGSMSKFNIVMFPSSKMAYPNYTSRKIYFQRPRSVFQEDISPCCLQCWAQQAPPLHLRISML